MSNRTELENELIGAERSACGSHLTHETRERQLRNWARVLYELGYIHVVKIEQITEKHILAVAEARLKEGVSKRTIQNDNVGNPCCLNNFWESAIRKIEPDIKQNFGYRRREPCWHQGGMPTRSI